MHSNQRSAEAQAYRHLYNSAAWKRRSAAHKQANPLCVMCKAQDRVTAVDVADHVIPHRGDYDLFFHGELQSLCHAHHSSVKQAEERGRTRPLIGTDGWPIAS